MKIIFSCAILTILTAFFFKVNTNDWCLLLICIGLVIALEMINTAIEELVDLVSPDYNGKAGKIKDLAAGAVLVASLLSMIIGVIIFWNYVFEIIKN